MNIKVTYQEIHDIVENAANQKISLSSADNESIDVVYTMSVKVPIIGKIEKDFNANIRPIKINGLDITIKYTLKGYLDVIMDILENTMEHFTDILTWGKDEDEVTIHLAKILEKGVVKEVQGYIKCIKDPVIIVEKDGLNITFNLDAKNLF